MVPQMYLELFHTFVSLPGPVSGSRLILCLGMALPGLGVERMEDISVVALRQGNPGEQLYSETMKAGK